MNNSQAIIAQKERVGTKKPYLIKDMPHLINSSKSVEAISDFIAKSADIHKPMSLIYTLIWRGISSAFVRHTSLNRLLILVGCEHLLKMVSNDDVTQLKSTYRYMISTIQKKQGKHTEVHSAELIKLNSLSDINLAEMALGGGDLSKAVKLCINARMGTGKTQSIGVPMAEMARAQGLTPIFIAHRIGLMWELSGRTGTVNYQDITQSKKSATEITNLKASVRGLSVCVNSLPNRAIQQQISDMKGNYCLFIDEYWQVLRSIASTDGKGKESMLNHLYVLMQNAKALIIADADMCDYSLNIASNVVNSTLPVYFAGRDVSKTKFNIALEHDTDTEQTKSVMAQVVERLRKGKKCVVYSDRMRIVQTLNEVIKREFGTDKSTMLICEGTKDTKPVQQFIKSANSSSHDYDCVLISPSITSGVSVENPDFTTAFAFYNGSSIAHADAIQQLARFRCVTEFNVVLGTLQKDSGKKVFHGEHYMQAFEDYTAESLNSETKITELIANCQKMEIESKANFAQFFMCRLWGLGYSIEVSEASTHYLCHDIKGIKTEIVEAEREAILTANDISFSRLSELKQLPHLKTSEFYEVKRSEIKRVLNVTQELTPEFLDIYSNGYGVSGLRRNGIVFGFIDRENMAKTEIEDGITPSMRRFPIEMHSLAHRFVKSIFGFECSIGDLMMNPQLTFRNSQLADFKELMQDRAFQAVILKLTSHKRIKERFSYGKSDTSTPVYEILPVPDKGLVQLAKETLESFGIMTKSIGRKKIVGENGKTTQNKEHVYAVDVLAMLTITTLGEYQAIKTREVQARRAEREEALASLVDLNDKDFNDLSPRDKENVMKVVASIRDENNKAKELGWGYMCPKCHTSTAKYNCPVCGYHEMGRVTDLDLVSNDDLAPNVFEAVKHKIMADGEAKYIYQLMKQFTAQA